MEILYDAMFIYIVDAWDGMQTNAEIICIFTNIYTGQTQREIECITLISAIYIRYFWLEVNILCLISSSYLVFVNYYV